MCFLPSATSFTFLQVHLLSSIFSSYIGIRRSSCVPFLMRYNAIDLYTSTIALAAVVTVSYSVRAASPQSLLPSAISNFLGPAAALKASSSVYNRKGIASSVNELQIDSSV